MRAVVITTPGDADVLQIQDVDEPLVNDDEVLIKISATALNKTDTFQRRGAYPPPKGASPYLGVECSGIIEALGKNVQTWKVGDEVCALLGGGGYAEKVAVPSGHVLPVPKGVSLQEAAAIPEVACTVWSTVFMTSHLSTGENFLNCCRSHHELGHQILQAVNKNGEEMVSIDDRTMPNCDLSVPRIKYKCYLGADVANEQEALAILQCFTQLGESQDFDKRGTELEKQTERARNPCNHPLVGRIVGVRSIAGAMRLGNTGLNIPIPWNRLSVQCVAVVSLSP